MEGSAKKLVVLDVMPLLYRGHFAFVNRPRMTSSGINTSAIFIFASLVREAVADQGATHAALVMDTSPTFRHDKFPEYKAQREKLPEDIAASIPMAEEFAAAMRIPFLKVEGFEADDLMGTLAAMGEKEGMVVWLVTPDKDVAQLVTDRTFLCRPAGKGGTGNEMYDPARVSEEWGIKDPAQMVDLLGLAGDASDNIPGVPGVGPKTASQLLADYGSIENVIAHAPELKGKLSERIAENADKARISRWLAEIRKDVPLDVSMDSLAVADPDFDAVREFCTKYELVSLMRKIMPDGAADAGDENKPAMDEPEADAGGAAAAPTPEGGDAEASPAYGNIATVPHKYVLCDTEAKLDMLVGRLRKAKSFAFDTETTGLDARTASLVGMSFAIVPHAAYYVPVSQRRSGGADAGGGELPLFPVAGSAPRHADAKSGMSLFDFSGVTVGEEAAEDDGDGDAKQGGGGCGLPDVEMVVAKFAGVFADPLIAKIGHNLKFDLHVLRTYGIDVAGHISDSMLAHYVLDPAARHGMDPLAREYLNYDPVPITALIGDRGKDQITMDRVDVALVSDYAAEDADVTLRLHSALVPAVKEAGAEPAFEKCENELVRVLVDMEREGVGIDTRALEEYSVELEAEIAGLEKRIHELAGQMFNIASSQQLGKVLFDDLKLPTGAKTSTGKYSTSEEVLQGLTGRHPIIAEILEYRTCTKLKSTYVDKLPKCIDPQTGRIHTSFNQALTETGRLSSDNPNLQNIPIRTERGRRIRAAFVPGTRGHVIVSADYSQIELRMMAAFSRDEAMIEAFRNDADIHTETASRVYGVSAAEVTREMRSYCKMVNFGIIYGISAFGLAQRLGTSRTNADELIKAYFDLYPGVKRYMDDTVKEAREKGYVTTIMGRRRPLRDINSRNATLRSGAERIAINTPVQGSAADLIKLAMVAIHAELAERGMKAKLVLQVHDELVFDAPAEEAEAVSEMARRLMTGVMELAVPLKADVGVGKNWLEAH